MLLSACGRAEILALFGMSVGSSVAVIDYISRIFTPIESLGMEIQTIQSAMAGVKRIDAFLVQPERALRPERKNAVRGDVVFLHVTFGYDGPPVLRDFSLTVKSGEPASAVSSSISPVCRGRSLTRSRFPPQTLPRKWRKMRPALPE